MDCGVEHILGWQVFFTRRGLPPPRSTLHDSLSGRREIDDWLDERAVLEGSPYFLDPMGRYDIDLNDYFVRELVNSPLTTQVATAYDLKRFVSFLWDNRNRTDWKDASEGDRSAFKHWRLNDPSGPRVALATWDREVATVYKFYKWAVRVGHAPSNPFRQRASRAPEPWRGDSDGLTPAEASHGGSGGDLQWLPPATYRRWRDIAVRGFDVGGLPDRSFRGHFASRNAAFCDLLIRTGLRLSEQTSLSVFEIPDPVPGTLNLRSWLPAKIAKGGSARRIYFAASVLKDIRDYVETDRAEAIHLARSSGAYDQISKPLIVTDPRRPFVTVNGEKLAITNLGHEERRRVLIETENGFEPAALWLNRYGLPSQPSAWQEVFKLANKRCERLGVNIRCHPHALRHSFAVITLEQLWRGHIEELADMSKKQRITYQMVFGDPLNWVRMRLGHSSIVTTQKYMHTLQELEMETRMALVPDAWEATGVHPDDLEGLESSDAL